MKNKINIKFIPYSEAKEKLQGVDIGSIVYDEYYKLRLEDLIDQLSKGAYRHILKDKYGENNLKMYYNELWC